MNTKSNDTNIGTAPTVDTLVNITPLARQLDFTHTVKLKPRLAQLYGLYPGLPAVDRPDLEHLLRTTKSVLAGERPGAFRSQPDSASGIWFGFDPARQHASDENPLGIHLEQNLSTEPPELILSTLGTVRKSVLLVTKDPQLVQECCVELEAAGVELVLAQDLESAPRLATQRRFDVVVMDLERPVELSLVHQMKPLPTLPHVLLTTRDLAQFRSVAFDLVGLRVPLFARQFTHELIGQVLALVG